MIKKNASVKQTTLLFTAMILVLFASSVAFSSFENSTAVGVEDKEAKLVLVNSFGYRITTDTADNNSQKVFNQGLAYSGTLFFLDQYYAIANIGAAYHTVDATLIEQDNGSIQLSDMLIGVGTKGFHLYKSQRDSVSAFAKIFNVLPLSERSRNEGYRSIPSISGDLAYQQGPWGFVISAEQAYVFNEFDTNVQGLYNLQSAVSGGMTLRYSHRYFRLQYSYRAGVRTYMDNNRLGGSGNSFSVTGIINQNFWASVSTTNVNYLDEQFIDVWFYNPFERIYNLRMGVTF